MDDVDPRTMRERMLAGDPYRADDPELVALTRRATDLADIYNTLPTSDPDRRRALLHDLLGAVGDGVDLRPPLHVDYGRHITVGAGTFANYGLVALDVAPITIGARVQLGPRVQLLTPTHPVEPEPRRAGWEAGQPISIGDNVWLGGGVIVLPGVRIGADTVVGAGAVVTRDLPAGVVAVGNPARVVRRVTDADRA
ncbi:sugar O-acetyltransferase [Pilimelia anulata]|uniref:sugar O-acetyltransferase n=1 Tax=Pilimelia anulata TaxID=53371 RepID=UPI00278C1E8F|nr:sugar O-acetyltransferase [Pilimelia anulata]